MLFANTVLSSILNLMDNLAWLFITIFLIELFSLAFFSNLLINALAKLFFHLTHSKHATIHLLAFLFLPGTVIHELAHVLSAGALMVHYGDIEFTPEIRPDGVKLGTAEIGKTDLFRRAIIGVAPVLVGLILILSLLFFVTARLISGENVPFWLAIVFVYVLFEVGNTMFSSRKDLEGAAEVLLIIIAFFIVMYILRFEAVFTFIGSLMTDSVAEFFKRADLFILVPIIIDLLIFGLVKLFLPKQHYY